MIGHRFKKYQAEELPKEAGFEELLNLFQQLLNMTGGDAGEALSWLTNLDKAHNITGPGYGIGDFVEDLKRKGFLKENPSEQGGGFSPTPKMGQHMRKIALDEVFGKLRRKKSAPGGHKTGLNGPQGEPDHSTRPFRFGDDVAQLDLATSLRNAQINHGLDDFKITENDLWVQEKEYLAQTSTVLMIDLSHSMTLYGEDRITPAKKVALALAELITTRYKKDTLDIVAFGNDAWTVELKELPYLTNGPYYTNTVAGLELAMDILRRRKNPNKQIFMITDGKPTCLKIGTRYYQNSFGLDPKVINKTLNLAAACRKLKIPITTFMIASDPYLRQFVEEFTQTNGGTAYYSGLDRLGQLVFQDFKRRRR